ncbi:MAG TPA: hypothetical protein VF803_03765, partial [Candidatus Paceibacterota bacterium]
TGAGCAMVSVSANTGASGDPKIVTSQGRAGSSVRTLVASVVYDASGNGQISSVAWSELTN